jgi:hypothetical protein
MPWDYLVPLLAIFMGCLIVLIPVAGITARLALKPIMDSWARYREMKGNDESVLMLERRMSLMEEHLHSIERSVNLLLEDAEFRRRLEAGVPARQALPSAETPVPSPEA